MMWLSSSWTRYNANIVWTQRNSLYLLLKALEFNEDIQPICLPEESYPSSDFMNRYAVTIQGWGQDEDGVAGEQLTQTPPDKLEASPAGSRSDDYVLAFLWFSATPPPKLQTILVCCCCSSWPGLPEPPSLRSKTKRRSQCFRALPANENSPPFTGGKVGSDMVKH